MNCSHYERNCYIISPCCGKNFGCRKCHDEFYEFKENEHKINRFEIKKIICKECEIEQPVSNKCINCKLEFGKYFCKICNFFDNDISKGYYHCEKCGICRVGGKENFFHCDICNLCLNINTKNTHKCIDGSEQNCPLCFDNLFESTKPFTKLKCGHIIHCDCLYEILKSNDIKCPLCSKSTVDTTSLFELYDREIELTPMPDELRIDVKITCNDCNLQSDVKFHIIGHKCTHCGSYNTKQIT